MITNAANIGKTEINSIEGYVPHYTPSIPQQAMLSKQISCKVPTELQYVERSVFMNEVDTQKFSTFELGTGEGISIPVWIKIGFQQKERQKS